jgi:lipoprotein
MKRLSKISLLLGGLLLTACSSPKISDVKVQIVDNAPQNYKKVAKTEIEITTRSPINGDVLNQEFNDVKINYYDKNNDLITTEETNTIREAVNQNKTNMTLVLNKGRGSNISYTAHLEDNKTESRTYNVPYIAEISSKVETEAELKNNTQENKDKDTYEWTGTSSKTIESIEIKYKQDYSDREYKYTYDIASGKYKYKWVTVKRTRVDEYLYRYQNNKLEFINQSQHTE